MATTHPRFLPILLITALLGACGERLDIEVKARIDGQPAAQAKVTVDREELGVTDAQGAFAKRLRKKAGTEVEVTVSKEAPGYRIDPWKTAFLVKLPKGDEIVTYRVEADLKATRYVTVRVSEAGAPVPEAGVTVDGKEEGVTDAKGEFVYSYRTQPAKGAELSVAKTGFSTYRATRQLDPGQVVEVALNRQTVVAIKALTDEYGRTGGVPGLSVSIDGKTVGKTDAQGSYTYDYRGEPGKKAVIALAAPGYVPAAWKTTVKLEGQVNLQRYFYPTTPRPIRIGIYRVVGNTPGVDLKELAAQAGQTLATQLFKFPAFREVPSERLQAEVNQRKLSIERITTKGWQDTPLRATVDMIALEGTIVAQEDDRYRINIGKNWRIGRGTEFTLTTRTFGEGGKVAGYRETGRIEVKRGEDASSLAEIATLKQGAKVQIGDRVVRRTGREGDEGDQRTYLLLTAKGGVGTDANALPGTSVYLNGEWAGATGTNGQAEVPLRLGRNYTLTLYRHGYQQLTDKIKVGKSGEAREFLLTANNALFKVDSEPSQATVYIDDEQVGKTPIAGGKLVTLGFHSVRLAYGEDYRDFFQVMEFTQKEEHRTGERRIVLQKDLLKIGERARQKGDIEGAIQAYGSTERDHPDYAEAHRRLGDIYLDDKEDYDRAITEFEAVLALPENQQLIYKQFAVTFTNLGHAYCEKGNRLVASDRAAAPTYFAKAIKALQTAKQNTRFFLSEEYDEAVHDTYYYTALSYHKLYLITKQAAVLNSASLAWREYFDFFPKKLEGNPAFAQAREGARRYRDQIQEP